MNNWLKNTLETIKDVLTQQKKVEGFCFSDSCKGKGLRNANVLIVDNGVYFVGTIATEGLYVSVEFTNNSFRVLSLKENGTVEETRTTDISHAIYLLENAVYDMMSA